MVEHLGADYFIWASDYPHIDASFGVVRELKERLAPLPEEARRKVLGLNAQRFYRLAGRAPAAVRGLPHPKAFALFAPPSAPPRRLSPRGAAQVRCAIPDPGDVPPPPPRRV